MRLVHRWLLGCGFAALAVALVVLLAPVHGAGLSGSALRPHVSAFGWYAYSPLPANPTDAQLRSAGVVIPSDVLDQRRREAAAVAALGVGLMASGLLVRRRRTGTTAARAASAG